MAYQITIRQKKILSMLSREQVITGEVLATMLSVTSRTVRNEISAINAVFGRTVIRSTPKGYSIDPQYFSLTKKAEAYADERSLRIQLTWKIFSGRCSNKAAELAEEYFVSTAVIYQQLKIISEELVQYQLELTKNGSYYYVKGTEFARRMFLNTMILADAHNSKFEIQNFNELFENIDITDVSSCLLEILFENDIQPEKVNLDSLVLNVSIAFDRLLRNEPLNYVMLQLPCRPESAEYRSALAIAEAFQNKYRVSVSDYDIRYFYLLVFGQTKHRYENLLEPEFISAVDHILKQTFQDFNLVCPYEPILEVLAYHIYFLIIRCKIGNVTYNSLLENLKTNSPFVYDVAVNLAALIKKHFSVVVADSEIGYLALVLGGMLEQDQPHNEKRNAVIVCGWHQMTGMQIQQKLTEQFSGELNFLGTIPQLPHNVADSEHILFLSCLSEAVPYSNVLTISPIVTERDIACIKECLSEYKQAAASRQFRKMTRDFFSEKLFFRNLSFHDKYEIIRFLCGKVIENGYAPEEFTEQVMQRERASSTCFLDTFAVPHPLTFSAYRSAFCILSTDDVLPWDEHQIKFVCLLVLSQKDKEQFSSLYQHLTRTLFNVQSLSAISEAPDFASFLERVDCLF